MATKQKKQRLQVPIDATNEANIPVNETVFDQLMASDRAAIINHALNQLRSDESLLLRLFYLSELDLNEIMDVTGFKESKVKVTLHRGRKSLLKELEKVFGNELIHEL